MQRKQAWIIGCFWITGYAHNNTTYAYYNKCVFIFLFFIHSLLHTYPGGLGHETQRLIWTWCYWMGSSIKIMWMRLWLFMCGQVRRFRKIWYIVPMERMTLMNSAREAMSLLVTLSNWQNLRNRVHHHVIVHNRNNKMPDNIKFSFTKNNILYCHKNVPSECSRVLWHGSTRCFVTLGSARTRHMNQVCNIKSYMQRTNMFIIRTGQLILIQCQRQRGFVKSFNLFKWHGYECSMSMFSLARVISWIMTSCSIF